METCSRYDTLPTLPQQCIFDHYKIVKLGCVILSEGDLSAEALAKEEALAKSGPSARSIPHRLTLTYERSQCAVQHAIHIGNTGRDVACRRFETIPISFQISVMAIHSRRPNLPWI